MADDTNTLKVEIETYEQHKDQLTAQSIGKYVLINNSNIIGVWDTYEDALKAGYEKFGIDKPFLVKRIQGVDGIHYFTRDIQCAASPSASVQTAR